jgi:hypothetical protein
MQRVAYYAQPEDFEPIGGIRCPGCGRADVFRLPVDNLIDRLAWAAFRGPFRCRACHRKFYRRIRKLALAEE